MYMLILMYYLCHKFTILSLLHCLIFHLLLNVQAIRHGRLYKPVVFSQASPPPRPVLVSSSSSARPPQPPLTISTSSHALPSTSAVASAASSSVAGSGLRLSLSIPKDQPK